MILYLFIVYPAITNSDDEDTSDVTWQPPSTVLIPRQRVTRKHNKCSHPKVEKPVLKKKKCKISKVKEEIVVKNLVCIFIILVIILLLLYNHIF